MEVYGSDYPPSATSQLLSKLFTAVQYSAFAFMIFGDKVFGYLQQPYPSWYLKLKEKKFQFMLFLYFGGNILQNQFTSTGAFEVFLGETEILSKLKTGQMPSQDYVVNFLLDEIQ